jgi:hypothetical protein
MLNRFLCQSNKVKMALEAPFLRARIIKIQGFPYIQFIFSSIQSSIQFNR